MYQPLENQRELRSWLHGEAPQIEYRCDIWLVTYFFFRNKRRVDGDNLQKAIMDGLQSSGFIKDDARIMGAMWSKGQDEMEYTHIFLHEVEYYDSPQLPEDGNCCDPR
jgi:Holliday junction resolvase RusA-like endonuclease